MPVPSLSLLTPEYPPQPGGVSDYVERLVAALTAAGAACTVIAPEAGSRQLPAGATLQALPPQFGLAALRRLRALIRQANQRGEPLLLQYVPHAFGLKGMNLPLVLLLCLGTRRLWTMFHEVSFTHEDARGPAQHLLASVQQRMARWLVARSERVFVSTSAWTPRLAVMGARQTVEELPIFSNLPVLSAAEAATLNPHPFKEGEQRIAHFGTFGEAIRESLLLTLPSLLEGQPQRRVLLMGRGAARFAENLAKATPAIASQLLVLDGAAPATVAAGLATASVVLQPFSDGVTTRRTSLMATLALGCPTVSTTGFLTEALWAESQALRLCPAGNSPALVQAVEQLLADAGERGALGARAAAFYAEHFSAERCVARLLDAA